MRSLAVSLSSCIYQCLCDSDSFYVNLARAAEPGQEGFIGYVSACHCSFYNHSFCTLLMCAWYKKIYKKESMLHFILCVVLCSVELAVKCLFSDRRPVLRLSCLWMPFLPVSHCHIVLYAHTKICSSFFFMRKFSVFCLIIRCMQLQVTNMS